MSYPYVYTYLQVFISSALTVKVRAIFDCVWKNKGKSIKQGNNSGINYDFLALGGMQETRKAFGRIVFETVYPPHLEKTSNDSLH